MREQIVSKERDITERDQSLVMRDNMINDLNAEIQRLNSMIEQNGMQAGDLSKQITDLQ